MPPSEPKSPAAAKPKPKQTKLRGGNFSLYEAVAGRITTGERPSITRARKSGTLTQAQVLNNEARRRIAPEDVLFRRAQAPTRYAERDIYWANERELPDEGRGPKPVLPDSDLLKSMQGYTCRFYEAMGFRMAARSKGKEAPGEAPPAEGETKTLAAMDEKSMDGTALLAFGILLEEAARSALGRTGDLAFVEPEGGDEEEEGAFERHQVISREPLLGNPESAGHSHPPGESSDADDTQPVLEEERRPKKKKRRRRRH